MAADENHAGPDRASVDQPLIAEPRVLRSLVGDLRQVASVRRIVLDDGPERGVRALSFSTGGGLDFWALADRSLDIGPLWWRGLPVAWQGPNGFRSPALNDPESEAGRGFMRSFGGLLVTCGLDHIRQPKGGNPLHGRLPYTPARVTAYGEDWSLEEPILFCEGQITQARLDGEALRLYRRIEAPIGGSTLRILDRVENLAAAASPQAMLYHLNLGFPFLRSGSEVLLDGKRVLGPLDLPQTGGNVSVACLPAREGWRRCEVHPPGKEGPRLSVAFDADSLPWLQLWLDPRPRSHVLGIEPCTSERRPDGTSGPERQLESGGSVTYRLELTLT
jgi:hypothetical protein